LGGRVAVPEAVDCYMSGLKHDIINIKRLIDQLGQVEKTNYRIANKKFYTRLKSERLKK